MGKPKCLNCFLKRRVFFDFYSENDNEMCDFQMSSTSALSNIRFEIFFHQISFLDPNPNSKGRGTFVRVGARVRAQPGHSQEPDHPRPRDWGEQSQNDRGKKAKTQ